MNESLKMSVSPVCHNEKDGNYAFASFSDKDKTVEVKIPVCEVIYNKGFSDDEVAKIVDYVKENIGEIKRIAAKTDVISALIK